MVSKKGSLDEQLIETVIEDYLKRNPSMRREDLLVQTIGGKLVVRTIKKAFTSIPLHVKQKQAASPQFQRFLDEIATSGNERYEVCQGSINSSKTFLAWMSLPRYPQFDKSLQQKELDILDKLDRDCMKMANALNEVKDKFSETINGGFKPNPIMIQLWIQEYMQSVLSQLKCQHAIFSHEVDLGDRFTGCVRSFMNENLTEDINTKDHEFIKVLAKVIVILRKNKISAPDVQTSSDVKEIDAALNLFHKKLSSRRKKLDELNQLIAYIEVFIEQMQAPPSTPTPPLQEKPSTHRMVFGDQKRKK